MNCRTFAFRFVSILLLGLSGHSNHAAETVYTWTDAQGVRHYSQYPPTEEDQPAETLTLETAPAAPDPEDRLQTIRDVARDLETARLQREEQRAKPVPPPAPPAPVDESQAPPVDIVPYPYGVPYPPPYPYPYPPPHRPRPPKPEEPDEPGPKPVKPPKSGARVTP